jgi:hypothetical protein
VDSKGANRRRADHSLARKKEFLVHGILIALIMEAASTFET